MIYIGLDDTDTLESRGTGHLARHIAAELTGVARVVGVTRHQLSTDPRVPRTAKNSSAAIHVLPLNGTDVPALAECVRTLMLADFQEGSDPGLCVSVDATPAIVGWGRRAKQELVCQQDARDIARADGIYLEGLGGTEDGVIGALAAVGLAAGGDDGRYVLVGRSRDLSGLLPVEALLDANIDAVQTEDGQAVTSGLVQTDKLRPARRGGRAVAVVRWADGFWQPLKLD